MSQDIVADALNMIMNARRRNKNEILTKRYSKFLIRVFELAKREGYIKKIEFKDNKLRIEFGENLHQCNAIKPRFFVKKEDIDKYVRRYLPAKDFGFLIVSTNKGIMTNKEAFEKGIGGNLIAYFY